MKPDLFPKSHLLLKNKCWHHKGFSEFPGISFVSAFSIQCPSFPLRLAREIQRMIAQTITGTDAPIPKFGWHLVLTWNKCSPERLCSALPSLMGGLYIWLDYFRSASVHPPQPPQTWKAQSQKSQKVSVLLPRLPFSPTFRVQMFTHSWVLCSRVTSGFF